MEVAGGKRLGSLPRALQHPEMNHSDCLSTYCNMNVRYLRRLSDLLRLCEITCSGPTAPRKEASAKKTSQ